MKMRRTTYTVREEDSCISLCGTQAKDVMGGGDKKQEM